MEKVPELCSQFSFVNKVGLSILNPEGIDICTLKNPTASAYILLVKSLLYRSASDRRLIYLNYQPNPGTIPLPPADSPNFDAIGLYYIYRNIYVYFINQRPPTGVPYILSIVEYINTYNLSGLQQSLTLENFHLFSTISASVPSSVCIPYFFKVLSAYFEEPIVINTANQGYYTVQSFYNLVYYTFADDNRNIFPLSVRLDNYIRVQNYLLFYQGASGIIKSFSQFVPVNVYENGLCFYSYNLDLPYGHVVRIILSQTQLLN